MLADKASGVKLKFTGTSFEWMGRFESRRSNGLLRRRPQTSSCQDEEQSRFACGYSNERARSKWDTFGKRECLGGITLRWSSCVSHSNRLTRCRVQTAFEWHLDGKHFLMAATQDPFVKKKKRIGGWAGSPEATFLESNLPRTGLGSDLGSISQAAFRLEGLRLFGRSALTGGVPAGTIDVRRLFHRSALSAAIFARRYHTGANGVRTLMAFFSWHYLFS